MTANDIKRCHVSQSCFAEVVGISRTRVKQLIDAGLLLPCDDGLPLIESLRNYFGFQQVKGCYSLTEYVRRFVKKC